MDLKNEILAYFRAEHIVVKGNIAQIEQYLTFGNNVFKCRLLQWRLKSVFSRWRVNMIKWTHKHNYNFYIRLITTAIKNVSKFINT